MPVEYERDALELFTPDLMALLMNRLRPFDVEIVDRAMYLYSRRPFDMTAPATYHRTIAVAEVVWRPAARRAMRWRDERTPSGRVGAKGARLRTLPTVGAVLGAVYLVAMIIRLVIDSI